MAIWNRSLYIVSALALLGSMVLTMIAALPAAAAPNPSAQNGQQRERPEGYRAEIVLGDQRFVYDRLVETDRESLVRVGMSDALRVFAATDQGPFDRVYGAPGPDDQLARYLPELPVANGSGSAENPCLNENGAYAVLDTGQAQYTFANNETDLTTDLLQVILETQDGRQIYAEPDANETPRELFVTGDADLLRFVRLNDQGRPVSLEDPVTFAEQRFTFDGDVTGQVDPASLVRVGCVGPYLVQAPSDQAEAPYGQIYVILNDQPHRVISFTASEDAPAPVIPLETGEGGETPAAETPATEETVSAVETPVVTETVPAVETAVPVEETPAATGTVPAETQVPIETAAPAETAVPAETPVPAETQTPIEATVVPTEPVSVETAVPAETVPAETPAPAETVPAETVAPAETTTAETPAAAETVPAAETPAGGETPAAGQDVTDPGRTGDFARTISVGDQQFLFDRLIEVDIASLVEVGTADSLTIYATSDAAPFDRVYGVGADGTTVARYWAEIPVSGGAISPDNQCPAEQLNYGVLTLGETTYAFAGPEPDFSAENLQQVATDGNGNPIYADSADQPFPELFFPSNDGLLRFILSAEDGQPAPFEGNLSFAGQEFTFAGDVSAEVDLNSLVNVGCAGPFPVRAPQDQAQAPFAQLYVIINAQQVRVLSYTGEGGVPPAETATVPAETATAAPAPTGTAIPETPVPATETAIPETPVPATETAIPETPVPVTQTTIPETPIPATQTTTPETPVPATQTAIPETPVPATGTAVSPVETQAPAVETVIPETPAAATTSTVVPPAETVPAEAPLPDVIPEAETPAALPTVEPPAEPVSAISLATTPTPLPAEVPAEMQVQGLRYLADINVDININTLVQIDVIQVQQTNITIYAEQNITGAAPRLYIVGPGGGIIRYLPEIPVAADGQASVDNPCLAEGESDLFQYTFEGQQYAYAFASVETNISVEQLRTTTQTTLGEIPTTDDGREILVRGAGPGFTEVFLAGQDLRRYIVVNEVGLPITMTNLVFAETRFSYSSQVGVSVSEAGLQRVGCAGAFPIYSTQTVVQNSVRITVCYTVISNRVFEFRSTEVIQAPRSRRTVNSIPVGVVRIVVQQSAQAQATALPNIRTVPTQPQPGQTVTPTPISGVVLRPSQTTPQCQGSAGPAGADGLPANLPRRIQLSGIAYAFAEQQTLANDIRLIRIGCVGAFEVSAGEGIDQASVLFLRFGASSTTIYRYQSSTSFAVEFVVSGNAQAITTGGETYVLGQTWQRSIYSSVTVIVYAEDPAATNPGQIFAVRVDGDVIAEYVPVGGDVDEPSAELVAAAEAAGVNPDMVLGGVEPRYVLVALWQPIGTTTNGWVTLYSSVGEGPADVLCATDPRSLDLFFYQRSGT